MLIVAVVLGEDFVARQTSEGGFHFLLMISIRNRYEKMMKSTDSDEQV